MFWFFFPSVQLFLFWHWQQKSKGIKSGLWITDLHSDWRFVAEVTKNVLNKCHHIILIPYIRTLLFLKVFLLVFNWFCVSTCIWPEAGSISMWPEEFQHIRASTKVHHPLEAGNSLAPTGEIIVHLFSQTSHNRKIKHPK